MTIYLPHRERAGELSAQVVAALHGWWAGVDVAPGDDLPIGNGVGLRFELGLDLGVEVDRTAYRTLYQSAASRYPQNLWDSMTTRIKDIRQYCYNRNLDPQLFTGHLVRLFSEIHFEVLASSKPWMMYAAMDLTAADIRAEDVSPYIYGYAPEKVREFIDARQHVQKIVSGTKTANPVRNHRLTIKSQ